MESTESLRIENNRLRTELMSVMHKLEATQARMELAGHGRTSAAQYAEDLEIQLDHVECEKSVLAAELRDVKEELQKLQDVKPSELQVSGSLEHLGKSCPTNWKSCMYTHA
jgi:uncharacterized protein YktB (UPF0637 family)